MRVDKTQVKNIVSGSNIHIGVGDVIMGDKYIYEPAHSSRLIERIRDNTIKVVTIREALGEIPSLSERRFRNDISLEVLSNINGDHNIKNEELNDIADKIDVEIATIKSIFAQIFYSTIHKRKLAESIVNKIGHNIFKREAQTYLEGILEIERSIDYKSLEDARFNVLSDESIRTIALIKSIENYSFIIESIDKKDKKKSVNTYRIVIGIMSLVLILIIGGMIVAKVYSWDADGDISKYKLPYLGVPVQVVIWGFIGSFASMLYRFNRNPIYDFGDTVKWLITRPIQGIVLSSSFYLVLISGQFLFTGNIHSEQNGVLTSPEIILFLSFLIGFSDRFNDSVFNTLIRRYSSSLEETPSKSEPLP